MTSVIPLAAPFCILYKEFKANQNVFVHLREKKDEEGIQTALTTLSPAYATYVAATSMYFGKLWKIPRMQGLKPFLMIVAAGHAAGQATSRMVTWEFDQKAD